MNVCFVCCGIPNDKYPLNGIFEFDQARALAKIGEKVVYFAIDFRSIRRKRNWGISSYEREGVKIYEFNFPIGRAPIGICSFVGKRMLAALYKKEYRHYKPDLFHAHFTLMGEIATELAIKENIPLVLTEHSSIMNAEIVKSNMLKYAKKAYYNSNVIVAVSSALAKMIKKHTGAQSIVVPNMLGDDIFFSSTPQRHDGIGFITTCNLIEHKRPLQLLKAFIKVAEERQDIFLGFIGDGELKSSLEKEANASTVKERIKFYGLQSRKAIAEIYKNYDCFVLPSLRETYGVSYIEAMAAGLPVIATRCGGPEDFVNEKNGLLIPVDDGKELTKAILNMASNIKTYDSGYIRNYVRENYSGEMVAKKLQSVYLTVKNKKIFCENH